MPSFISNNLLTWIIFLPLIGAFILLLMKRPPDEEDPHGHAEEGAAHHDAPAPAKSSPQAAAVRGLTLIVSFVTFLLSLTLWSGFDARNPRYQFVERYTWLEQYRIEYHLGLDGISLPLVLLTTFLSVLCVLYSFNVKKRIKEYMVFLLALQSAMTGVFCALDLALFYIFFEAVLIPMYFLIGIWGHENRLYAAIKFFLYTFIGSVLMLVAIVYLYATTGTLNLVELLNPGSEAHRTLTLLDLRTQLYLYGAFALAFMIKVPMFPFHTWLPDAHVEAPTAGSVILAGVLLKMGTYGFIRFCLPLFPEQAQITAPYIIALAIIGIIYGAIVAAVQPDMKKLVAYSSVSHLGFVMLGIYSFNQIAMTGALLQNINHGISTGMLFFMVGMMYDRRHTREIAAYGGIKRVVPVLAAFFLIALLSSIALPLTNGFVGEFTILLGSYQSDYSGPLLTGFACSGMVLSAVYMLWLFQRVFTGPINKSENRHLPDLNWREKIVLAPLIVLVFWIGCYVTPLTKLMDASVVRAIKRVGSSTSAEATPPTERRIAAQTTTE